ncbi:MAG TPA: hypothetical protein EYQ61_07540 [Dehalococcoidia bacterium]|jgi:pimeloyl-ACP methyl ester carboxylesterase|nr:hypothetical protein [Dehalococcoidia bacterium]
MRLLLDGFTHHTVNTGEVEIGYSVGPGNGPAMLLLHGMSSRRDGFMHVTGILSEKHKVFMMDQRGHGYSGMLQVSTVEKTTCVTSCSFSKT